MRRVLRGVLAAAVAVFGALAYIYLTLPDVRSLASTDPVTTAFIERRTAEARRAGRTLRHEQRWVRYDAVSPHLRRAVVTAEDGLFWQHDGIDVAEIKASIRRNLSERSLSRGASTITQQLAKNLYLSPSKHPVRKLRELMIARRLEVELPKRRILELYLNVIEWGDGVYGAEAASRRYFRKPASALEPAEAALLAGAIVNPRVLSPSQPGAKLRWRQQMILSRLRQPAQPGPVPAVPPEAPAAAVTDVTPEVSILVDPAALFGEPIEPAAPPVDEPLRPSDDETR